MRAPRFELRRRQCRHCGHAFYRPAARGKRSWTAEYCCQPCRDMREPPAKRASRAKARA